MGGIPRGALSGPLQSPFSSLSSPGSNSISDEHFPIVVNGSKVFSTICQICHCAGPCYYKSDGCNKWAFSPMLQS